MSRRISTMDKFPADGVPPHKGSSVHDFLDETFLDWWNERNESTP